jgi:hypothetical protein
MTVTGRRSFGGVDRWYLSVGECTQILGFMWRWLLGRYRWFPVEELTSGWHRRWYLKLFGHPVFARWILQQHWRSGAGRYLMDCYIEWQSSCLTQVISNNFQAILLRWASCSANRFASMIHTLCLSRNEQYYQKISQKQRVPLKLPEFYST